MKNILLAIAAMAVSLGASAQGYTITGTVEGLADGEELVLKPYSHDDEQPIATATVENGRFVMKGMADEPLCVRLLLRKSRATCELILENADITVSGKMGENRTWNVIVSGSPLTERFRSFVAVREHMDVLYKENWEKFRDVHENISAVRDDAEAYKTLQQTDRYKEMEKADSEFLQTMEKTMNNLFISQKDTFWGPLLATRFMNYFTPAQRDLYNQFGDAAKQSYYGRKMKQELWPVGSVGEKVMDFTLTDETGKTFTFADLSKGKKYVLIDFWASWCGPCRKEIPNVKRQYELYKDKGFEVVGISIDKDAAAWKKALEAEQLTWPSFLSTEVADLYKVKSVPTVYLVDADRNIVAEGMEARAEKLAAKLEELFK